MLLAMMLIGQNEISLQLLDATNQEPIQSATFQYGQQSGLSDDEGRITIVFTKGNMLELSHLNYGQWSMSSQEVEKALSSGIIHKKETFQYIQPVTIIALRPKKQASKTMDFDIQDKLSHDGGTVLNQSPLINGIRKSGSYGFDPVLRGFKYDQLNVVINGVQSCAAACPNRMDPATSQIAPNMMASVEIFKGPHSLRYGSAFGGTINFISPKPRFIETKDTYGRLSSAYESNGNITRTEGLIGFSGKKYDLGVYGSLSKGDDYFDGEGNTVSSSFYRGSLGTNLAVQLNKNQIVNLSATRNQARDARFPALPMDLREDDTWLFNAGHEINLKKGKLHSWKTNVYGSLVNHLMDNGLKNLNPRMMNAATDATNKSYGGRTEGEWLWGTNQVFAGLDSKFEEAEGIRTRSFLLGPMAGKTVYDNAWQHALINKTALFGEYHFKLGHIHTMLSARLERNQAQLKNIDEGFASLYPTVENEQLNPSISIGGIRNYEKGFSIGLWLGRAVRSASMTERYINYFPVGLDPYEMVGNPELLQEKNHQLDLVFGYKSHQSKIELSFFSAVLKDYISSEIRADLSPKIPNSPGVRQYINIDQALLTGFELNWQQELLSSLHHQLSLAYTYGQDHASKEALPEIAPLDIRYSLMGQYLDNKLNPELKVRYVMEQNRVSTIFGETKTPAFVLLDFNVQYQISKILSMSVSVNNLLDEAYYEHLSRSVRSTTNAIYAPGRSFVLSLSLDLM